MTEKEARTKWCPEVRMQLAEATTAEPINRWMSINEAFSGIPPDFNCIASGCMMWRWSDSPEAVSERIKKGIEFDTLQPKGYCGKAGKP